MRLKTLGVVLITALALFGVFYWVTDTPRRTSNLEAEKAALLAYGTELFALPTTEKPANPGCAQCHGPEGKGGEVGNTGVKAPNLHSPSIATKLQANSHYVNLVIRFGGVVVSGNVKSPMPAWSAEVGGALNVQQVDALTALVESWAKEAAASAPAGTSPPNNAAAGDDVYHNLTTAQPCASCHGQDLAGVPKTYPNLQKIGSAPVTDLPTPISGLAKLQADYKADPRKFLEQWIRDSSKNYNGGASTGMPSYGPDVLSDAQLQALITFLLEHK
ncbi:MAG: c-type cytochrome [Chloroflexota bacterium]|nr:c-type cytochrome [Chloroflexota bacterium]